MALRVQLTTLPAENPNTRHERITRTSDRVRRYMAQKAVLRRWIMPARDGVAELLLGLRARANSRPIQEFSVSIGAAVTRTLAGANQCHGNDWDGAR
jgi:hypothetical protein